MKLPGPLFELKLKKKKKKNTPKKILIFQEMKIFALILKKFLYFVIFLETEAVKKLFIFQETETLKSFLCFGKWNL